MKQQQFEAIHQQKWQRFEVLLDTPVTEQDSSVKNNTNNDEHSQLANKSEQDGTYDFISLYRLICQHYALAKQRNYSPQLVARLHELVTQGHHQLYQRKGSFFPKIFEFFAYTFPVRFREHIALFWLSFICFTIPLVVMGLACYFNAEMLHSVMSAEQVANMESMYNPANEMIGRDSDRRADTDLVMFGHYIQNNVGIDFQIYGMGLFAGIGTLFSLFYNGVVIGGVAGHLTGVGYSETFWPFVAGHGSFELTAAVISGAAGLRLAQSLFMPGNYTRADAFKIAGIQSIQLLMGAASMTFIAAFIEAFWSSSGVIPVPVKFVVAAFLWLLVISYLVFAGKSRAERERTELANTLAKNGLITQSLGSKA